MTSANVQRAIRLARDVMRQGGTAAAVIRAIEDAGLLVRASALPTPAGHPLTAREIEWTGRCRKAARTAARLTALYDTHVAWRSATATHDLVVVVVAPAGIAGWQVWCRRLHADQDTVRLTGESACATGQYVGSQIHLIGYGVGRLLASEDHQRMRCAHWVAEHGDPADWSAQTRSAYRAAMAGGGAQ